MIKIALEGSFRGAEEIMELGQLRVAPVRECRDVRAFSGGPGEHGAPQVTGVGEVVCAADEGMARTVCRADDFTY